MARSSLIPLLLLLSPACFAAPAPARVSLQWPSARVVEGCVDGQMSFNMLQSGVLVDDRPRLADHNDHPSHAARFRAQSFTTFAYLNVGYE